MRPRASLPLLLSWLGFLCGAIVAALGDVLPWRIDFVGPGDLLTGLAVCQVFFALFVWPLFIPSIAARGEAVPLLAHVGALALLGLPLVLVCANVSDAGAVALVGSQVLAAALAALVAGIYSLGMRRGWRIGPWYVLGASVVSGGPPLALFVAGGFGSAGDAGPAWAAALSPFWGPLHAGDGGALLQGGVCAVLAGAAFAAARIFPREAGS